MQICCHPLEYLSGTLQVPGPNIKKLCAILPREHMKAACLSASLLVGFFIYFWGLRRVICTAFLAWPRNHSDACARTHTSCTAESFTPSPTTTQQNNPRTKINIKDIIIIIIIINYTNHECLTQNHKDLHFEISQVCFFNILFYFQTLISI
jgi:hypothetical protein